MLSSASIRDELLGSPRFDISPPCKAGDPQPEINAVPKTLTLADRRKLKQELAEEIRKQGEAYDQRRAAGTEAWPDETREAWKSVNKKYDDNEKELIQLTNDDEVRSRIDQMQEDEEQSRRTGHKPGLDDRLPGEERTYGELGIDREQAAEIAQRQADKRNAFRTWLIGTDKATDEMRTSCERLGYEPGQELNVRLASTQQYRIMQRQMRAMNETQRAAIESGDTRALSLFTATAGPELVPQTFVNMLEMAILSHGNMLQYFDTITTAAGESMSWPIGDDTSNEGEFVQVEGSDTQASGEPNPTLKRTTWNAHEVSSKWIKVPFALNEDSMFDLEVILATMLGERIGRIVNRSATTGDGNKQCRGILLDAPVGHTSVLANAIALDDLIKLEHSVDPAVRPQSQYAMNDAILETLRLLKDSEGRQLWQQSMRDGQPDRINNRQYAYNQVMADTIQANAEPIIFGRLSDYKLRRVGNVRVLRAAERFMEKLQLGFLGYARVDGKLLRPTADAAVTVKKLKQPAS